MNRNSMKKMLSLLLCVVLIAAMALMATGCSGEPTPSEQPNTQGSVPAESGSSESDAPEATEVGEGETVFYFSVVDTEGKQTEFKVSTNEKTVGAALVAAEELTDYIENGKNMCVEAEADHPLFWEDIASFSAGTEKSANLIFDERMESYELKRWEVEPGYFESEDYSILDKGETVISENGVFEVPADGKMYVYELYVKYEGGGNCWYGFRIDSPDDWGLTLSVSDVTATGLTVIFTQSGGNPTGELMTGSYYRLESADGEEASLQ